MGLCYGKGLGVVQSYEEAVKWYSKSAEQGYARAQYNLGRCYEDGLGAPQCYEEAVKWYSMSAKQGLVNAQCRLGFLYFIGLGVDLSMEKCVNGIVRQQNKAMLMPNFYSSLL